jgi:hypothetical protein
MPESPSPLWGGIKGGGNHTHKIWGGDSQNRNSEMSHHGKERGYKPSLEPRTLFPCDFAWFEARIR